MANDLNNLIKKRSNPFGDGKFSSITDIQKEIEREETPVKKVSKPEPSKSTPKKVEKKPEPQKTVTPKKEVETNVQEPQIQSPKVVVKPVIQQKQNEVRDKYTATMETELRTRVKIASAKMRIQFSQFIELAVTEKLEREGF